MYRVRKTTFSQATHSNWPLKSALHVSFNLIALLSLSPPNTPVTTEGFRVLDLEINA